jgi:hypothetical protein
MRYFKGKPAQRLVDSKAMRTPKQSKTRNAPKATAKDPLKETAVAALKRVLEPLVDLMFDTGITVQEFGRLVRDRAVRSAAVRVARESGRVSNSRVAIMTGLGRTEVARILETTEPPVDSHIGQHPARKVLAAWHENRRFQDTRGNPAVLPIFGARKSFEQLVAQYGGASPVRAMLDQLTEIGAVEILSAQRVKVRTRVPIFRVMTMTEEAPSSRARKLPKGKRSKPAGNAPAGVTIYYFEDAAPKDKAPSAPAPGHHRRKNFQRHVRPITAKKVKGAKQSPNRP